MYMLPKATTVDKVDIPEDLNKFDMKSELESFKDYVPKPEEILIRLYIRGNDGKIILPNGESQVYTNTVGYVARMGTCCFEGERYENWGKWYNIGDWLIFPRQSGIRFIYGGLPVFSIRDDAPIALIKDPTLVSVN